MPTEPRAHEPTITEASREGRPPLERFYRPRSIAVVGAHDTRSPHANMTGRLRDKAQAVGATIHYVNPRLEQVFGQPTHTSIVDVPGDVDVMVVMVGDVVGAIEAAAPKRPAFTVVFAAGFEELGTEQGNARAAELVAAAAAAGTRLVGPNTNINSLELLDELPGPKVAVVTQSGMQGRPLAQAQQIGLALSYWATTGNEADLEAGDFIEFFARDAGTRAVAGYIEGFRNGDSIRRAALAALETDTPIVLIKVGRSAQGSSVARSHTGHLAGADRVHDAFFRQYGITRVDDIDELIEVTMVMARCGVPPEGGLGLLCASGGTAAHLADLAGAAELSLPTLGDHTQAALREMIGDGYLVSNPVDNGGHGWIRGHGQAMIEAMVADPAIAVVLVPITGDYPDITVPTANALAQPYSKPVIAIWSGPTTSEAYRDILDAGVPVVRNLRNALVAARALLARRDRRPAVAELVAEAKSLPAIHRSERSESRLLDEAESTRWLVGRGIPFVAHRVVDDVPAAIAAAGELGFPVVLKAIVDGVAHKSESGLVALGLESADDLERAAKEMHAGIDAALQRGWIVARQATGGVELLAGLSRDPVLGPVVVVGLGGVLAELLDDVALSVLPLTRARAHEMLDELRGAAVLDGWRGSPGVDREAVVDALMALADLARDDSWEEVDVNPLLATPSGVLGLDALVRVSGPAADSQDGRV